MLSAGTSMKATHISAGDSPLRYFVKPIQAGPKLSFRRCQVLQPGRPAPFLSRNPLALPFSEQSTYVVDWTQEDVQLTRGHVAVESIDGTCFSQCMFKPGRLPFFDMIKGKAAQTLAFLSKVQDIAQFFYESYASSSACLYVSQENNGKASSTYSQRVVKPIAW